METVVKTVESGLPTLVSLNEFIKTVSKSHMYPVNSLGGYVFWVKKNGCPKKWSYEKWEEKLEEFLKRNIQ